MFGKMKKFLATVALVAGATLTLTGCGGNSDDAGTLKVGSSVDFAPFEFQEENVKDYQGFDMDLIRAVGDEMGRKVVVNNISFDGLIPALDAGNIDVAISGITINDERKEKVAFTDPYYQSGLTIVVREDDTNIKTFKDLSGHRVGVQIGTTAANEVKKIPDVDVVEFNTVPDIYMDLKIGGIDAAVNDRPVNDYFINHSHFEGVKTLPERLTAEDYGIAVSKKNEQLVTEINNALKKLRENGKYTEIYEKWFGKQ